MLRLRVGDLDQWVRYAEPERPEFEVSLDAFLAYMRREGEETDIMRAGHAFHEILEHAAVGELDDPITCGGFKFQFDGDFEVPLPVGREMTFEKTYRTPSGLVLLRGKLDGHDGEADGEVIDYKLTFSGFDAERYADSLQWRAYLDMTGARRFVYRVFEANRKGNNVWVYGMHPLVLWTYADIGKSVHRRVCELAEFVVRHVPSLVVPDEVAA